MLGMYDTDDKYRRVLQLCFLCRSSCFLLFIHSTLDILLLSSKISPALTSIISFILVLIHSLVSTSHLSASSDVTTFGSSVVTLFSCCLCFDIILFLFLVFFSYCSFLILIVLFSFLLFFVFLSTSLFLILSDWNPWWSGIWIPWNSLLMSVLWKGSSTGRIIIIATSLLDDGVNSCYCHNDVTEWK